MDEAIQKCRGFVLALLSEDGETVATYTSENLSFVEKLGLAQVILSDVQAEANGLIDTADEEKTE